VSAGEDKAEDRGTCTPCRGRGKVTSALGGQQHVVTCPWCGGTGRFQPGRDAQESPAERDSREAPAERDSREPPEQDAQ
jgi:DnaJ-class molecular chaperone